MIGVQDLRKGTTFIDNDGNLFVVLDYRHNKQGRGNATINVKARDLRTGAAIQKNFQSGGRVEIVTARGLSPHLRKYVLKEAIPLWRRNTKDSPIVSFVIAQWSGCCPK